MIGSGVRPITHALTWLFNGDLSPVDAYGTASAGATLQFIGSMTQLSFGTEPPVSYVFIPAGTGLVIPSEFTLFDEAWSATASNPDAEWLLEVKFKMAGVLDYRIVDTSEGVDSLRGIVVRDGLLQYYSCGSPSSSAVVFANQWTTLRVSMSLSGFASWVDGVLSTPRELCPDMTPLEHLAANNKSVRLFPDSFYGDTDVWIASVKVLVASGTLNPAVHHPNPL